MSRDVSPCAVVWVSMTHALALLAVRADRSPLKRYDLAPPEVRDSGVVVYEAVLSTPGVSEYPELGITERVTADVLRDPDYLAGLSGLPIIDNPDLHWSGVRGAEVGAARIGTVLDARWDDAQQATIVRLAIDPGRGQDAIRRGVRGLSLQYTPRSEALDEPGPDGATHAQRDRRRLNHVLLTDTPRDIAARIRADATGGRMTPEQIAALKNEIMEAIGKRADAGGGDVLSMLLDMLMSARSDAAKYRADMDDMQKRMDAMTAESEGEPDNEPRADAWRSAFAVAERAGVEVKDDAKLSDIHRAVVAKHLPQRADAEGDVLSDAYALTVAAMEAAEAAAKDNERGAGWRKRADSNPTTRAPSTVAQALTVD